MKQSNVVTIVAFIFVLLSGFTAFAFFIPALHMLACLPGLYGITEELGPKWFYDMPITKTNATVFSGFYIASLASFILSCGLRIRRPWVRVPFAVEMVLLTLLMARVLQLQICDYIHMAGQHTFPFDPPGPGLLFTFCSTIFCIWFIKHLLSRRVAAEFRIQWAVSQESLGHSLRKLGEERNDIHDIHLLEKAERAYHRSLNALAAPDAAYYRETAPDAACYHEQVLSELKAVQALIRDWKADRSTLKAN
ncbi:hypothetical protein LJC47_01645 [Desulfosarcina sp. OttesenSCG-928-B08]|nr:hypothetical protein [Desulfosarcina sp. OttesenSCG-928-B08]